MFGGNWRLLRSVVALSLPTVVVVALGVFFFVDKVPEIEKAERNRVKLEYRETALAMRQNPDGAEYHVEKTLLTEWRRHMAGQMTPGRWGYVPKPVEQATLVWYDDGVRVVSTTVPIVLEVDYRTMFLALGLVFLLVLVGMTIVGIRYFVEYIRTRDDFLAATAHDLTTPLVGMRYSIGRNDEEAKVLNERMIRLVTNIKDFLRLGGKRPKPQRDEVDLVKCYKEAYALFREDVRDVTDGSDLPVAVGTDPTEPLKNGTFVGPVPNFVAVGDETLVVQILWNLIGNDLKYALPFGPVRVRFFRKGGFVCVEFADEGQGMSKHEMARAFDRYYRAKTVLESGKGGFGIGLCTAREFARSMGGDLSVRANSPHGCVFTLSLPAAKEGNEAVS